MLTAYKGSLVRTVHTQFYKKSNECGKNTVVKNERFSHSHFQSQSQTHIKQKTIYHVITDDIIQRQERELLLLSIGASPHQQINDRKRTASG